jgi:MFS family permease
MVIWSQLGIIGYLIGPLAGGGVAETIGYAWLGVVPAAAGLGVVAIRSKHSGADHSVQDAPARSRLELVPHEVMQRRGKRSAGPDGSTNLECSAA